MTSGSDFVQWNIRGINDKSRRRNKVDKIISMLENATRLKLLNIQETHLQSTDDEPSSFRNFCHLYNIIHSYAPHDDRGAGICIFVNKTDNILVSETLLQGRLLYLKLQHVATQKVTNVFSYYGKSTNRSESWMQNFELVREKIANNNLENVLIFGDFNFVVSPIDRNSRTLNSIDHSASTYWVSLENSLGLKDCFRITNPKRILYTYSHTDGRSKSRIDRIYATEDILCRIEASNFEGSCFSDHKIVRLRIGNCVERGPGSWIFNNSLLRDQQFTDLMWHELRMAREIKATYPSKRDYWDFYKMNIQSVTTMYATEKARLNKLELSMAQREIDQIERLPMNSLSEYMKDRLLELNDVLKKHETKKIEGMKLRAKLANFDVGEPKISYLSRLEKMSGERNTIYSLRDEQNVLKDGTEDMLEIVHNFYKDLYTREAEDEEEQNRFLDGVTSRISPEELIHTERELYETDLLESLGELQKNKSPGFDGVTVEYYLFFWSELKDHLMDSIAESKMTKELSEMQKRGAIRTSFKKENRDNLKNYRPITLLNVDLKIITRTLAKRMASVLPNLINISQKAIPGRHITTNIHIAQDLINLINKSEESAALLFYDQEKAFDRMSHSFIIKTLEKFGFGENFITWVKIIMNDIKSFVKVNGFETSEFDVKRGVRQGCALSALLYVLASEVLAIEIRNNRRIKGFKYKNVEFKLQQYADDIMTVVVDLESIEVIFEVFRRYELATNARLNKTKTEALWVGGWKNRTDTPYGLKWKRDYVNFTGVYIGNATNRDERKRLSDINFSEIDDKITKKIAFWKGSGIAVKGKIRVINTFIYSKLFYRLECVDLNRGMVDSIDRKIKDFIWDGRVAGRINFETLKSNYDKGGMQLFDLNIRAKLIRVKWLYYLTEKTDTDIERFLADKLIGDYREISGLNILKHNTDLNKFRSIDNFYLKAIKAWRDVGISWQGENINSIKDEVIYDNTLLTDSNNNTFSFFNISNRQRCIPIYFKDLPVSINPTHIPLRNRSTISQINLAFWNLRYNKLGNVDQNSYCITYNGQLKGISTLSFKDIYKHLIDKRNVDRGWENKWNNILRYYTLDIDEGEWERIWEGIHDKLLTFETQSTIWNMIHLNFYCGYKEKIMNYGEGKCRLCGEIEQGSHHIITECNIMKACINMFMPILEQLSDEEMSNDEMTFGMVALPNEILDTKCKLRNLVTFVIRQCVFKTRHVEFSNSNSAISAIKNKIKFKLKEILYDKWIHYKYKRSEYEFRNIYLTGDILGKIENQDLILSFLYI